MTSAMTVSKTTKRTPVPMNGVDTPKLLATIQAVGAQPELAKFRFRAQNRWISGPATKPRCKVFTAPGASTFISQHAPLSAIIPPCCAAPTAGPTPVEWLLHALASCLMSGVGNIASARGIKLNKVEAKIEGDIDLSGLLGLSKEVRNGYQGIKVSFDIDGDASPEQLEQIVMQSKARSAVFDVVTNGVAVSVGVKTPALA